VGRSVRCTTPFSNTVWNNFSLLYSSLDLNCAVSEPPFGPAPFPSPAYTGWSLVRGWKMKANASSSCSVSHEKKMNNIRWWGWIYPYVFDLVAYRRISLHHSPTQSNRSSSTQLCLLFATYLPIFYYQNYSTTLSFSFVLWQASIDSHTDTHTARLGWGENQGLLCPRALHNYPWTFYSVLLASVWVKVYVCVCACMSGAKSAWKMKLK